MHGAACGAQRLVQQVHSAGAALAGLLQHHGVQWRAALSDLEAATAALPGQACLAVLPAGRLADGAAWPRGCMAAGLATSLQDVFSAGEGAASGTAAVSLAAAAHQAATTGRPVAVVSPDTSAARSSSNHSGTDCGGDAGSSLPKQTLTILIPVHYQPGAAANGTWDAPGEDAAVAALLGSCPGCVEAAGRGRLWAFAAASLDSDRLLEAAPGNWGGLGSPAAGHVVLKDALGPQQGPQKKQQQRLLAALGGCSALGSSHITFQALEIQGIDQQGAPLTWTWWMYTNYSQQHAGATALLVIGLVMAFVASATLLGLLVVKYRQELILHAVMPRALIAQLAHGNYGVKVENTPAEQGESSCRTAADAMVLVVGELLHGRVPRLSDVLLVRTALLQGWDLHQPLNLDSDIRNAAMDTDVAEALLQELHASPAIHFQASAGSSVPHLTLLLDSPHAATGHESDSALDSAPGSDRWSSLPGALGLLMTGSTGHRRGRSASCTGCLLAPGSEASTTNLYTCTYGSTFQPTEPAAFLPTEKAAGRCWSARRSAPLAAPLSPPLPSRAILPLQSSEYGYGISPMLAQRGYTGLTMMPSSKYLQMEDVEVVSGSLCKHSGSAAANHTHLPAIASAAAAAASGDHPVGLSCYGGNSDVRLGEEDGDPGAMLLTDTVDRNTFEGGLLLGPVGDSDPDGDPDATPVTLDMRTEPELIAAVEAAVRQAQAHNAACVAAAAAAAAAATAAASASDGDATPGCAADTSSQPATPFSSSFAQLAALHAPLPPRPRPLSAQHCPLTRPVQIPPPPDRNSSGARFSWSILEGVPAPPVPPSLLPPMLDPAAAPRARPLSLHRNLPLDFGIDPIDAADEPHAYQRLRPDWRYVAVGAPPPQPVGGFSAPPTVYKSAPRRYRDLRNQGYAAPMPAPGPATLSGPATLPGGVTAGGRSSGGRPVPSVRSSGSLQQQQDQPVARSGSGRAAVSMPPAGSWRRPSLVQGVQGGLRHLLKPWVVRRHSSGGVPPSWFAHPERLQQISLAGPALDPEAAAADAPHTPVTAPLALLLPLPPAPPTSRARGSRGPSPLPLPPSAHGPRARADLLPGFASAPDNACEHPPMRLQSADAALPERGPAPRSSTRTMAAVAVAAAALDQLYSRAGGSGAGGDNAAAVPAASCPSSRVQVQASAAPGCLSPQLQYSGANRCWLEHSHAGANDDGSSPAAGIAAGQGLRGSGAIQRPVPPVPVPYAIVERVEKLLAAADQSWQIDAFELARETRGHALSVLCYYLVHRAGLIARFKIQPAKLARYLQCIEAGYRSANPYHNAIHAADVLHSLHMVLVKGGLVGGYADSLTLLACYLAAATHDYQHTGLNNDFLVATQHPLALRYNDRSPLENHHAAAGLTLLTRKGTDCLKDMPASEFKTLRKLVIELVLATDMKQHFTIVSQFTSAHSDMGGSKAIGRTTSTVALLEAAAVQRTLSSNEPLGTTSLRRPAPLDDAERLLALQMALKCSDLGHTAASLDVHLRWLDRLEEEFFLQGDAEQRAGLPISPLFDRTKQGASKSQVGFYEVVVLPLLRQLAGVFPGTRPLLDNATANYKHWKELQEAQQAAGMHTATSQ